MMSFAAMAQGFSWDHFWSLFITVAPIWLLGAITGYLLPRPKSTFFGGATSVFLTSAGLRNAVLAGHGLLIVRDMWYQITDPGTFRRFCKAVLLWTCRQGWHFDFPASDQPGVPNEQCSVSPCDDWYVTEKDLAFFQYHGEGEGGTQGAGPWEPMMDKEMPNQLKYTAWRRVLPNGKTEYKSTTIVPDATAQEFTDLYFDDSFRPEWDAMISAHSVAEAADFSQRQAVVRWTRKFPFSFINSRQYTIARRLFVVGDRYYGITKSVPSHPSALEDGGLVSVDQFHSMWVSRTVACPWGSGRPAVETVLLHHEQLKIPENLARFAVRHGMWSFVKKMGQEMPRFVAARRARGVSPNELDPGGYGAPGTLHAPPMRARTPAPPLKLKRAASMSSALSSRSSSDGTECGMDSLESAQRCSSCSARGSGRPSGPLRRLRSMAALAAAGTIAMLVGRKGSLAPGADGLSEQSSSGAGGGGMRRSRSYPARMSTSAGMRRVARHSSMAQFEQIHE
uniref:START domain-containing protein n=1 Tax=Chlamydomonas euryale TaxID=1486919 RepID=A0A7R9V0B3_9CHLO|mmetsp:Transcript_12069/g.35547  ORF Transcript_12069/g.35547 Transcript_12069/m.35547 type:complete len:508 (+) Transcript_12069:79-1602(+)